MGYLISWQQHNFTDYTYSNVIKTVSKLVDSKFTLKSWGFTVGPDLNNCVAIERDPTSMTGVKTNRDPYTKDVMKTLIIMVEFGAAQNLDHDDEDMSPFLEALDEIQSIFPLVSYELQKAYFMGL